MLGIANARVENHSSEGQKGTTMSVNKAMIVLLAVERVNKSFIVCYNSDQVLWFLF